MTIREGSALDVLLFGKGDEELVDIKCFRGDRDNVSSTDIERQIQEGILQHKMHPNRASPNAPSTGAERVNVADFVARLPIAA